MAYGSKTKKPKDKTVVMIAVGKLKAKKNGTKRNGKKKKLHLHAPRKTSQYLPHSHFSKKTKLKPR